MSDVKSFRELLTRSFGTIDVNPATGGKVDTQHVSRNSFLADYEIDALVIALREFLKIKSQ